MAAQGAEIIKVEPIEGESTRKLPPFAQDEAHQEKSLWFAHYNTDKKSVTAWLGNWQWPPCITEILADLIIAHTNIDPQVKLVPKD